MFQSLMRKLYWLDIVRNQNIQYRKGKAYVDPFDISIAFPFVLTLAEVTEGSVDSPCR